MSHSVVFGLSSSILKGAEFSVAKGTLQYQMYVCPISHLVIKLLILFCVITTGHNAHWPPHNQILVN